MAMAVVGMAWPQPGEPHPIQPLQGRSQIAPLTLKYGQEPPRIDAMPRAQFNTVLRVSWPDDKEPRLSFNNQQPDRRYVAPITLVYGAQPPIVGALSRAETNLAVRTWDAPRQEPPRIIGSAAWDVPIVQTYIPPKAVLPLITAAWVTPASEIQYSGSFTPDIQGDQPTPSGPISPLEMAILRGSWEPPRPEPPALVKVATLTLPTGQQPPFVGLSVTQRLIARAESIWWPAQSETDNAGWNFPVAVVDNPIPFVRQRHAVLYAWQPPFVYPASEPDSAWNIPPIVSQPIPFVRQRHAVLYTWQPQFVYPAHAATLINFVATTLDRAIAQSDAADALSSGSSSIVTLIQNSGTVSIISVDSKTIQLITGSSGVSSIDSDD